MEIIILNGDKMTDKDIMHKYLKRKLRLPDYYGENLDALWDILSTVSESMYIRLINIDHLYKNLDSYGESLIELLKDVMEENNNINFEII